MLSALGQPEGAVLAPTLARCVAAHPSALHAPIRLSAEAWTPLAAARAEAAGLPRVLSHATEAFAAAVEDLTFPQTRWRAARDVMLTHLSACESYHTGTAEADAARAEAARAWAQTYEALFDTGALRRRGSGAYNLSFAERHSAAVVALMGLPGAPGGLGRGRPGFAARFRTEAAKLESGFEDNRTSQQAAKPRWRTAHLSVWLARHAARAGLEMPGQYWELTGPPSDNPVLIAGVDEDVAVLKSKQMPKRLTLRGDDGRGYDWVAKGAEDIRLDERLQRAFALAGRLLSSSPDARDSSHPLGPGRLSLPTFRVLPSSPRGGLLEFVPRSVPLSTLCLPDAAARAQSETECGRLVTEAAIYAKAAPRGPDGDSDKARYRAAVMTHTPAAARAAIAAAHELLAPGCALAAGLRALAPAAAAWVTARRGFGVSAAAVSAVGWVCGVGDRHLDNFLVDTSSGRLIAIDFGYSFGTATQVLPIPELIPFRLTRAMLRVLAPTDGPALIAAGIGRALAALRSPAARAAILAAVEVFAAEPAVDWMKEAMRMRAVLSAAPETEGGGTHAGGGTPLATEDALLKRLARQKLGHCAAKLAGGCPVAVLCEQLRSGVHDDAHVAALDVWVRGEAGRPRRALAESAASAGVGGLSPEQQAVSLVDLATDGAIQGIAWRGLALWM